MDIILLVGQFVILGAILYFLLIRPENKRRKKVSTMQNNLQKGDRVVTMSGLRARVHILDEATVTLITDEGVKLNFERRSIARKVD